MIFFRFHFFTLFNCNMTTVLDQKISVLSADLVSCQLPVLNWIVPAYLFRFEIFESGIVLDRGIYSWVLWLSPSF